MKRSAGLNKSSNMKNSSFPSGFLDTRAFMKLLLLGRLLRSFVAANLMVMRTQSDSRVLLLTLAPALLLLVVLTPTVSAYPRPGRTERVSVARGGTESNGGSYAPVESADGRYVAFDGNASNLVPGQNTNGTREIF